MTHRLTTNCAKNYCNRTLIVKVIVENVVTCFLLGHSVYTTHILSHSFFITRETIRKHTSLYGTVALYGPSRYTVNATMRTVRQSLIDERS